MKRLGMLGLACYLLALLLSFPAGLAVRWLAPAAVGIQGPTGSVWSGMAQAASYAGYYLGTTHWTLRPLDLLRGRLAYHVEAQGPDGFIDGIFAITPGGTVWISTLSGVASMQSLAAVLPPELPASLFTGRVQLKLDELRLADGWPQNGRGQVDLVELTLLTPIEPLGSYTIQLDGEDGADLQGSFHDVARNGIAGPLEIKGTITLSADRTYAVRCTARARPNASPNVQASLGLICPQS